MNAKAATVCLFMVSAVVLPGCIGTVWVPKCPEGNVAEYSLPTDNDPISSIPTTEEVVEAFNEKNWTGLSVNRRGTVTATCDLGGL